MNVGHPSNLARLFELFGGTVDRVGNVYRYPDREEMRKNIYSVSVGDQTTKDTMKSVYDRYRIVLEPHGAVGWRGLEIYLEQNGDFPLCVSLETAHPAKFSEEVKALTDVTPEMPQSMKAVARRTGDPLMMSGDYGKFKEYLCDTLQTRE
jgi:threonine synthase